MKRLRPVILAIALTCGCSRNIDFSERSTNSGAETGEYGQYQSPPIGQLTNLWIAPIQDDFYTLSYQFNDGQGVIHLIDWKNQTVLQKSTHQELRPITSPFEFSIASASEGLGELQIRYQLSNDFEDSRLREILVQSSRYSESRRIVHQFESEAPTTRTRLFYSLRTNAYPTSQEFSENLLIHEQRRANQEQACAVFGSRASFGLVCMTVEEDQERYLLISVEGVKTANSKLITLEFYDRLAKSNVHATYEIF